MLVNSICSFKTIPNGLRQQPLAAAIIPFAVTVALRAKLPDPSNNSMYRPTGVIKDHLNDSDRKFLLDDLTGQVNLKSQ